MPQLFAGVGVALITVFSDDGDLDAAASGALAAHLVEVGVRAVVVAGTTGEAVALTEPERAELVGAVRAAVPDDVPVIAGTGAPTGRLAAARTASAVDAGADAVLALAPARVADPRPYYDAVAKAAGPLGVLAYSYPAVSPPGIAVEALPDLPVVGVKDSSGDPDRLLGALTSYDGDTYVGSAALVTMAGVLGAAGAILALANVEPERCIAAFDGDAGAQRALYEGHRAAGADFPTGVKRLVAARWGVSAGVRIGT